MFLKQLILFIAIPLSIFGDEISQKKSLKATTPKKAESTQQWYSVHGGLENELDHESETVSNEPAEENEQTKDKEEKEEEEPRRAGWQKCSDEGPDPWPYGNFALPTSQQLAPLVSFGQLIVDKGDLQYYFSGETFWGKKNYRTELTPSILYGITDDFSAFVRFPFEPRARDENHFSSGIGDIALQLEYAYYTLNTRCYSNQATVVSTIFYPSGDSKRNPPTGFGSPSFFIGGTFNHMDHLRSYFCSAGGLFPTYNHGAKIGDEYFYEFGYEQVISASYCRSIFAWMVEVDGVYSRKDRSPFEVDPETGELDLTSASIDPNSGGNVILVTPSLWYSTKRWIFQAGVNVPVIQHLNGNQRKENIGFSFIIALTM